jgi:hypothetical protein
LTKSSGLMTHSSSASSEEAGSESSGDDARMKLRWHSTRTERVMAAGLRRGWCTCAPPASSPPRSGRCALAARRWSPAPVSGRGHRGRPFHRCGRHPDLHDRPGKPSSRADLAIRCRRRAATGGGVGGEWPKE